MRSDSFLQRENIPRQLPRLWSSPLAPRVLQVAPCLLDPALRPAQTDRIYYHSSPHTRLQIPRFPCTMIGLTLRCGFTQSSHQKIHHRIRLWTGREKHDNTFKKSIHTLVLCNESQIYASYTECMVDFLGFLNILLLPCFASVTFGCSIINCFTSPSMQTMEFKCYVYGYFLPQERGRAGATALIFPPGAITERSTHICTAGISFLKYSPRRYAAVCLLCFLWQRLRGEFSGVTWPAPLTCEGPIGARTAKCALTHRERRLEEEEEGEDKLRSHCLFFLFRFLFFICHLFVKYASAIN